MTDYMYIQPKSMALDMVGEIMLSTDFSVYKQDAIICAKFSCEQIRKYCNPLESDYWSDVIEQLNLMYP